MSARETALQVLTACRKEESWVNEALKKQIAHDGLDARDAALATRLTYGVVQNRLLLDHYLKQLLQGKGNLRPVLRDILHLGLYQLYFMDKIPASAAVNESVALAKRYCKKMANAPALTNAVLRNADRSRGQRKEPEQLWQRYSHPQPLVQLLEGYLGSEALEAMLQANNAAPSTVIQTNTLKLTTEALLQRLEAEGVQAQRHPWMADCLILGSTGSMEKLPSFREGCFYVQDAAARLAVDCAGIQPGQTVADCCAAPGGKSFAAALRLQGEGEIFSSELHPHRVALIEKGAARLGISNIRTACADACLERPELFGKMDTVLVDVPCSGYGIIRKKPDIRYKDPDTMKELPALQLAILNNQAKLVRPGGVLLYATCTLVRRENEGVVEKFRKANPEFVLEPLELPSVFPKNETGMLRLLPGQYDTDGFFIAKLRRK